MIARFFDRQGCIVGLKFRTYSTLEQWYVCNWCGGQIVHYFTQDRDYAHCADCQSENFIPLWLFEKQVVEGPSIVATLPAEVQALFKHEEPVSAQQAIDELYG
jgi:hypothetical protein